MYFAIAGAVYFAEVFEWDCALVKWDQQVGDSYQRPGWPNIFGTDILGRSVFRKTLYGAKISLTVALCASLVSLVIGVTLGTVAGYYRGFLDDIIVWIYSTLSMIPWVILVMAFAIVLREKTVFGIKLTGITGVYLAIGLSGWVSVCRLIRAEIIKIKESHYVLAACACGCSGARIIVVHLIPNVLHIIIITFSLRFVRFIHMEVILGFLGLGETTRPGWGVMINDARMELARGCWWQMTAAAGAIFLISLALNIFADELRDCLDPKLRAQ